MTGFEAGISNIRVYLSANCSTASTDIFKYSDKVVILSKNSPKPIVKNLVECRDRGIGQKNGSDRNKSNARHAQLVFAFDGKRWTRFRSCGVGWVGIRRERDEGGHKIWRVEPSHLGWLRRLIGSTMVQRFWDRIQLWHATLLNLFLCVDVITKLKRWLLIVSFLLCNSTKLEGLV